MTRGRGRSAEADRVASSPSVPEAIEGTRRADRLLLFDVGGSHGADDVARVLADLGPRLVDPDTEVVAVGDGHEVDRRTAAILAERGVRVIAGRDGPGGRHGVPLAVAAGLWLAGSKPGAMLEIVSDDLTFDTVGNVAASRGAIFRRRSYSAAETPANADGPIVPHGRRPGRRGRRRR